MAKKTRLIIKTKKGKGPTDIVSNAEITGDSNLSFNEQREAIRWVHDELETMIKGLDKRGLDPTTIYFSIAVKEY